ncbi:transcriptional regulator NrdR [Candidatus Woesearchaeota archaeon CG10_big_fil_rev_8_21_14_0_10_36_11]|nr:MAG: transcriptional regulator NrdR [Candidatus Woesearchaeota archaeon CG10_big_fil_rev_8_21_14_0_10_36_11]
MFCPFCSHEDTKVLESRVLDSSMRRRRECAKCKNRFTTYEKAEFQLTVLKKDGRIQPFDSQKIAHSIQRALGKVDSTIVNTISLKVERSVLKKKINPVKTVYIGKCVLDELKKIDKIAYLRFASVHKDIEDPKMFEKELQTIV